MTFTPNFNFDFNNNWQFQNQNWNSFQPMFNNNFGGFNGFNFNNIWGSNTSGQTTISSKTSSGDSDYDAWYEKRMKGAYSSASGEDSAKTAAFLEEKSNEIVKTQAILDDTNKKIDALKKVKDNGSKVVDASLMQDTELNEDGTIKSTEKKEKGFFKKAANWLSSAGSALLSMGKSLVGFDKDGKWHPEKALKNAAVTALAVGATFIPVVGPAIGYGLLAYGVGSGVVGVAKGVQKLNNAKTEQEEEQARQDICAGAAIGITSAMGLRGLGKAASTTNATTTSQGILSKLGQEVKNISTNPLKATTQAVKSDYAAVKSAGFFKTFGNKATSTFKSTNYETKFNDKYNNMETGLNNKLADINSKIAAETNPAKKVLLEEQKSMLEGNLNELHNLQNIKTKVEFDNLRTTNSATKNQEKLTNYTQQNHGYEINGQAVSKKRFEAFESEMKSIQKIYKKDLKQLLDTKECVMRKMASKPDGHITELNEYTQSSIRAKYKTSKDLKNGIKDINTQLTDVGTRIADVETKLQNATNPRRIHKLQNALNGLKNKKATLENELTVCNSIKFKSRLKPSTWGKNEYVLNIGGSNASYGLLFGGVKKAIVNPAATPLLSMAQWDREFSVPFLSTDLVEMTPEQLEEAIKGLETQKAQLEEGLDTINKTNTAQEWSNLKASAAAATQQQAAQETGETQQTQQPENTQQDSDKKADKDEE